MFICPRTRILIKKEIIDAAIRMNSHNSQSRKFKEVSINVPWGQISGKWWEPFDTRPILSLHGWQVK